MNRSRTVQASIMEPPYLQYYEKYKYYHLDVLRAERKLWRGSFTRLHNFCTSTLSNADYFDPKNPHMRQMYRMRDRLTVIDWLIKDMEK